MIVRQVPMRSYVYSVISVNFLAVFAALFIVDIGFSGSTLGTSVSFSFG